ncbi:hypothetical protein [Buttiauxella sp. 3AFRM03]|nr:hypothetical protein [Buttiauxella sp. 3AFRM03]
MLKADLDKLSDHTLTGNKAYEVLRILEMRRQTAKLEFIKQALHGKRQAQ